MSLNFNFPFRGQEFTELSIVLNGSCICKYIFPCNFIRAEDDQSFEHIPEFPDISCPLDFLQFTYCILSNILFAHPVFIADQSIKVFCKDAGYLPLFHSGWEHGSE